MVHRRDRTRCEAGHVGKTAGSHGTIWVRQDEVNALGVSRVEADALGDRLMKKNSLGAYLPAEVPEPAKEFTPPGFLGVGT
jgi:hypothetical protein